MKSGREGKDEAGPHRLAVSVSHKIQTLMKTSSERKCEERDSYKCTKFAVPACPSGQKQPLIESYCFLTSATDGKSRVTWTPKSISHIVKARDSGWLRNKYFFGQVRDQTDFVLTDQLKRRIVSFIGGTDLVFCCCAREGKKNLEEISRYLVSLNAVLTDEQKCQFEVFGRTLSEKDRLEDNITVITARRSVSNPSNVPSLGHFIIVNICQQKMIRGFAELLNQYRNGRVSSPEYLWNSVYQAMKRKCNIVSFVFCRLDDISLISLFATTCTTTIKEDDTCQPKGSDELHLSTHKTQDSEHNFSSIPRAVLLELGNRIHTIHEHQSKLPESVTLLQQGEIRALEREIQELEATIAEIDTKFSTAKKSDAPEKEYNQMRAQTSEVIRRIDRARRTCDRLMVDYQLPKPRPLDHDSTERVFSKDVLKEFEKQRKRNQEFLALGKSLENDPTTGNDAKSVSSVVNSANDST